jgi:hypothetical protein
MSNTKQDYQKPNHYTKQAIQPLEYIIKNNLGFIAGNIIKYVTRYKYKDGIKDLKKARDYLDELIKYEESLLNESSSAPLSFTEDTIKAYIRQVPIAPVLTNVVLTYKDGTSTN